MDLVGLIVFLAVLGSVFIIPFVWVVFRGEKSGDVWEGEWWDKMAGRFPYIDQRLSDMPDEAGIPLAELPMFGPVKSSPRYYLNYLIWKWGWIHPDFMRYLRLIKKKRKEKRG